MDVIGEFMVRVSIALDEAYKGKIWGGVVGFKGDELTL